MKHGIKPLGVVRPVPTRWNSVAMTSKLAIYLERALNELVSMASHNRSRGAHLLCFKLAPDEWELLKQLDAILAVCIPLCSVSGILSYLVPVLPRGYQKDVRPCASLAT